LGEIDGGSGTFFTPDIIGSLINLARIQTSMDIHPDDARRSAAVTGAYTRRVIYCTCRKSYHESSMFLFLLPAAISAPRKVPSAFWTAWAYTGSSNVELIKNLIRNKLVTHQSAINAMKILTNITNDVNYVKNNSSAGTISR
jgi:hypothetical protein